MGATRPASVFSVARPAFSNEGKGLANRRVISAVCEPLLSV